MDNKNNKSNPPNKNTSKGLQNLNTADYGSRKKFLKSVGIGIAGLGLSQFACTNMRRKQEKTIQGFENENNPELYKQWEPISDRKIKVGLVGYGLCDFAANFGFQNHPNVEVVAVSDLFPDRCEGLAKEVGCDNKYSSLEELIKDDNIEAVFVATDAPSHAEHCIKVLESGKHVATAVPAVWGSLEDAERLYEVVKKNRGLKYMMFETSCYRANNYAMRQIYNTGGFGKIVYAEGEYYHPAHLDSLGNMVPIPSYKGWRDASPPQWYPTHGTAYYVGVTGGSFTEVSCMAIPSQYDIYKNGNNQYNNPFDTEIALFRTNEGGMARMAKSASQGIGVEDGRIRGENGSYYGNYDGIIKKENLPDLRRPGLPAGVPYGGHGGSHGNLMQEFIYSIIEDRKPEVDIAKALNMTVSGIVAHQSALNDGELMKIPQYESV